MECSVCKRALFPLSFQGYVMCKTCYEGARGIVTMMDQLEYQKAIQNSNGSPLSPTNSFKGGATLADAKRWLSELSVFSDLAFLRSFVTAYKQQIHTDILVLSGDCASPIPAHKAVLATRSEIFKNMLDSDECKVAPSKTITLSELKYEELECLLEFLYSGTLAPEKLEKHVKALTFAADKYGISHLEKYCELYLLNSLSVSNVLDILEIAESCSNQKLLETTFSFLVENIREIASSSRFEAFALERPRVGLELVQAMSRNSSK